MPNVLTATDIEYDSLNNLTNGNNKIEFTKDGNNKWIISKSVLNYIGFNQDIINALTSLEEIEYVQPVYEDI